MWILGIDGGGTHTRIEIRDGGNAFIRRAEFGPFNLNSIGEAAFRRLLEEVFADCGGMEECGSLCAGGAGVSNPRAGELFREELQKAGFHGSFRLCGDQEIALRGAIDGPGMIIISGTGSICFGKNGAGEIFRAGGCGHLIDDGGSGYAVGRDALSAAVRALDGRRGGSETLRKLVFGELGIETREELIKWVYAPERDKSAVAKLSGLVLQAAETDVAAREILEREAEELRALAEAVGDRLGLLGGRIALLGGLLSEDNLYRRIVARALGEIGEAAAPAHDALWGAAQTAWEILGK